MSSVRHASARRRLRASILAGGLVLTLAATGGAASLPGGRAQGAVHLPVAAGPTVRRPAGPTVRRPAGPTVRRPARARTRNRADPLAADRFYVDPGDTANLAVRALRAQGDGTDADAVAAIADQPQAIWLTTDAGAQSVAAVVTASTAVHRVPIFVVYNLPGRDCGSYSAGGATGAADYRSFIERVVSALGRHRAVVILEPDALSETCMPAGTDSLLGGALARLDSDPRASVYVDAGNPGWQTPAAEAQALAAVIGSARAGFAVNVSNFYPATADIAFGTAISQLLGGRHFVVDTSRDGGDVVPGQWCNPAGAALGSAPTTRTGSPLVDAELWIKQPGESDGTCNGGPPAGQFWLSGALSLVGG